MPGRGRRKDAFSNSQIRRHRLQPGTNLTAGEAI